jgi:hypothetical protein
MRIYVQGVGSNTICFEEGLSPETKILALKQLILKRTGGTLEDLTVIFGGKVLGPDRDKLAFHEVGLLNNTTLVIV